MLQLESKLHMGEGELRRFVDTKTFLFVSVKEEKTLLQSRLSELLSQDHSDSFRHKVGFVFRL